MIGAAKTQPERWNYLLDMDGVLVHEEHPIAGADQLLAELAEQEIGFMVLTNNSIYTPRDLRARLSANGLEVPEKSIWTSALATARFLDSQRPGGSAYVIGEAGLTTALHEVGYVLTDRDPDYVVLGETRTYSFTAITKAVRLLEAGARFIATNPDETGPSREGLLPATGAVAALIERATGRAPYYVGKPNPLMMRSALRALGAHSENTLMVGDRMDTDVRAGMEAGMQTILVMSGISGPATAESFPFRPTRVIESIAELVGAASTPFSVGVRTGTVVTPGNTDVDAGAGETGRD
ncbi:NagD protein [Actinoalloteichus hymeniacidonis]|nr:NagD protein [Actinoalloteichus hymeniacidonis]